MLGKIISNFIALFLFVIFLETMVYYKDFKEIERLSLYIKHDIEKYQLESFCSDRYCVDINYDLKRYEILYNRKTFIKVSFFKIIKYSGTFN